MDEILRNNEKEIAKQFFKFDCENFKVMGFQKTPFGIIFRFFHPQAQKVTLVDSAENRTFLNEIQPCFFSGKFSEHLLEYFLEVDNGTSKFMMEDAYRFPLFLSDYDNYLFNEGTHQKLWKIMGAQIFRSGLTDGVLFRVWAPLAKRVAVVGDFNEWNPYAHGMRYIYHSGIWEIFVPGAKCGNKYKYHIIDATGTILPLKIDPFAIAFEHPPKDACIIAEVPKIPTIKKKSMVSVSPKEQPISIYEVHLGSWRQVPEEKNRPFSYFELEKTLVPYVSELGFTHVQLMPITEYPFDPSWGYQPLGMYAPTIRHGTAKEFAYLVQAFHCAGIKVLLDFVPAHFPGDEHGLRKYDGSSLFEYEDLRLGYHPDWNSYIYNYKRTEVRSFLINSILYWAEVYHVDGFRVDAVSSMVYLDYSRKDGEWEANIYGGNHNLEAISFLKDLNTALHGVSPEKLMIAEESTSFPMVSQKIEHGGLGFDFKWNMGWMHDTLTYMKKDPLWRKGVHGEILNTFSYAYSENFILPLSHDEVTHGKGSLWQKMSGADDEEKFANLRTYYGLMWAMPGKKLLFMGGEFAQKNEWDFQNSLDWNLSENLQHEGVRTLIKKLNLIYVSSMELYSTDCRYGTLSWIKALETYENVFAFERFLDHDEEKRVLVLSHFSPVYRPHFRIGTQISGDYEIILNSSQPEYGGNIDLEGKILQSEPVSWDSYRHSVVIDLPPLSTIFLKFKKL